MSDRSKLYKRLSRWFVFSRDVILNSPVLHFLNQLYKANFRKNKPIKRNYNPVRLFQFNFISLRLSLCPVPRRTLFFKAWENNFFPFLFPAVIMNSVMAYNLNSSRRAYMIQSQSKSLTLGRKFSVHKKCFVLRHSESKQEQHGKHVHDSGGGSSTCFKQVFIMSRNTL